MRHKLSDKFKKMRVDGDLKLTKTTLVKDFPEQEIRNQLDELYSSPDSLDRKIATFLNAVYTHQRAIFIMSRRIFAALIKNDPNVTTKSLHQSLYNRIMAIMRKHDIIKSIREPVGNKVGLEEVSDTVIRSILEEMIGKIYLDAQKEAGIEWYESQKEEDIDSGIQEIMKKAKEM